MATDYIQFSCIVPRLASIKHLTVRLREIMKGNTNTNSSDSFGNLLKNGAPFDKPETMPTNNKLAV